MNFLDCFAGFVENVRLVIRVDGIDGGIVKKGVIDLGLREDVAAIVGAESDN